MTVWICGTSVSLSKDGYSKQLRQQLPTQVPLRNISIGDQTSIFGLVRVMQHAHLLEAGDAFIWEYPLLDILLEDLFGMPDILHAMQHAWTLIRAKGVHLIILKVTPRNAYHPPSAMERQIDILIARLKLPCIDTREIAASLKIPNPADEYEDDRHPRPDSRLLSAITCSILTFTGGLGDTVADPLDHDFTSTWDWFGPDRLVIEGGVAVSRENSFMSVQVVKLTEHHSRIELPALARIIAVASVCTHEAGSLWCAHNACMPASLRLPDTIGLKFLVRGTRIPCARGRVTTLVAAPDYAFGNGAWADYGHTATREPGPVEILGILGELANPPETEPVNPGSFFQNKAKGFSFFRSRQKPRKQKFFGSFFQKRTAF